MSRQHGTWAFRLSSCEVVLCVLMTPKEHEGGKEGEKERGGRRRRKRKKKRRKERRRKKTSKTENTKTQQKAHIIKPPWSLLCVCHLLGMGSAPERGHIVTVFETWVMRVPQELYYVCYCIWSALMDFTVPIQLMGIRANPVNKVKA